MVRRALAILLAAATFIGVSRPASAGAARPSRASLQGFVCRHAANLHNRLIEVTAVIRHIPGTQGMQLRFVLLRELVGQSGFSPVHGPGLGNWLSPRNPTLGQLRGDTWRLNKPVVNLPAPATYRFRVTFRWVGSSGVIASQTRLSPLCTQPR